MFEDGIAVIGLGYIGLPTCAALTRHGLTVTGVDVNERTVSEINAGRVPIVEPDLDVAIDEAVSRRAADGQHRRCRTASVYLIAVPTPFTGDHEPDLRHVRSATEAIAPQAARRRGRHPRVDVAARDDRSRSAEWLAELRPDLKLPHLGGDLRRPPRALPRAGAAGPDHGRDLHQRPGRRRPDARRARERAAELYRALRHGRDPAHRRDVGRDGQADGERLPRRQHRLRQRARRDLRDARPRRVGGHPSRQPPPAGQHPPARPRRRRPLHRRRPVVHRRGRARAGAADPDRPRDQRRPAAHRHQQGEDGARRARQPARTARARRSPASASPSRPTSTTCASRPPCRSPSRSPPSSRARPSSPWSRTSPRCRSPSHGRANVELAEVVVTRCARPTSSSSSSTTRVQAPDAWATCDGKKVIDTRGIWR